jgi:hypothetical protein
MVRQTTYGRSHDQDFETFDEDITGDRVAPCKFGRSAKTDYPANEPVPLFLSEYDDEPDPRDFINPLRKRRVSISVRILLGVSAAAAVAILFALFSSDATRDIIINAKASIAAVLPGPSAAAQPDPAQITARDRQLQDPARPLAPTVQPSGSARGPVTVGMAPSREEITNAYQSALQSQAPAAAPPVVAVPPVAVAPPVRSLDAEELAMLMRRARGLLEAGDIPPARLLLERAADAQDPTAALLLAQTYDPDVLGTFDVHNIMPEPAKARAWYQKAAQLGSADAQRRLAQLQN